MSEMDLKTVMQAIMAASRSETAPPSPDELLSFRTDLLDAEEQETLLQRAATSPETARALLDARRFPDVEPVDERHRVTESEVARQWQGFQDHLQDSDRLRISPARPTTSGRLPAISSGRRWLPALFHSLRFAQAAAAALLLVSLGLSWTLMVERSMPDAGGPRVNLPIIELVPESAAGERADSASLSLPEGAGGLLLVLTSGDRRSYPVYEIEIRDAAGEVVWNSMDLQRASEGFFSLELPRGFLGDGRYRIALWGIDGGQRDPLAAYTFAIAE